MNEWVNRYKHLENKVGGGFYSIRKNISQSGVEYTKLVKSDRSPVSNNRSLFTKPIVRKSGIKLPRNVRHTGGLV